MSAKFTIGILGCGTIGEAILSQIIEKKLIKKENLLICEKEKQKEKRICQKYNVKSEKIEKLIEKSDFLILAIKPQDLISLIQKVKFSKRKVLISVLAGIDIDFFERVLKVKKIVRAMPNLMIKVGKGIIVWKDKGLNKKEREFVKKIFEKLGESKRVKSEDLIDKATLISGCGPGYLYFFEELILESFENLGFSRKFILSLLIKSFSGALFFQEKNKEKDPKKLVEKVASKGGVTSEFLKVLKEKKIFEIFREAAKKAFEKNKKLKLKYD